ncbi:beta/alpha barrel domain-containing protein [Sphingomonas daechungensis]|uniref:hypothetical protein n=1 Tax=Sphingomonas daechungensis TaxID=1176646 RepID=UPI00294FFE25|nr:hypothetical protein [Sphingomonas daechungensis]
MIGAGTVLDPSQVAEVANAGGRLIVSPNANTSVIEATVAAGMVSSPGYFTPSEAFDAIRAGLIRSSCSRQRRQLPRW